MFCSFSVIRCAPENMEAYLDLRRREIDPRMAASPGFIKRDLFRALDTDDEIMLTVYWESKEHAQAYRKGAVHEDLKRQALQLLKEPLKTRDYETIDQ